MSRLQDLPEGVANKTELKKLVNRNAQATTDAIAELIAAGSITTTRPYCVLKPYDGHQVEVS